MGAAVRELFCELADVPLEERQRIFAEREIPADLRSELECLLGFDLKPGQSLTRRVSKAIDGALTVGRASSNHRCGPYRLGPLLGAGGMGAVYLAERTDGEIEQKVAVKLLRADQDRPAWRERFLRERQLLAYLNHPSIARLLDAGHTKDGRPFLVMEYVKGVSIDQYADSIDLPARLRLFLSVCEGVSYAHCHSIVHRDLKPSNILVDSSGHPKLLDFGIAKLVDATTEQTRTVERLLTPDYASPEQRRGDAQTTATDIYSLGAVLYRLLTGRAPRQEGAAGGEGSLRLLNRELPRDLICILRKALRSEPSERYESVDAFAGDIRAFLDERPVKARCGNAWYLTRRFLRRYRIVAMATAITTSSIVVGLNAANHQRRIADTRLVEVRRLANQVLALGEIADNAHNTGAMTEIITVAKKHLEPLIAEAHTDRNLTLEVVEALTMLARAQGVHITAGAQERAHAAESLRKANALLQPVLSLEPFHRKALLLAAKVSQERMILSESSGRKDAVAEEGRNATAYLETLLSLGPLSERERQTVAEIFYDAALTSKNLHHLEDGIRYAQRSIEISRSLPQPELRQSMALSMLADLLRLSGDLDAALRAIREARASLSKATFASDKERRASWARVSGREGKILGLAEGVSLNRPAEAVVFFQKAFNLVEEWTRNDRGDTWSRLLFTSVGRELGDALRPRNPKRALAIYDHALLRLGEVKDNPEARRGEAELLAASSKALRSLGRFAEARERIDAALRLLGNTKDYPSEAVSVYSPAYETLRALGDHLQEAEKNPEEALKVYEDLLHKVNASQPDMENDLAHALAVSEIYGSLATLYYGSGNHEQGAVFGNLRRELWRRWDHKLPGNAFVQRQIAVARAGFSRL